MVLHGIVFASVENGVIKMSTQETPEEFILGSSSEMNDNEAFHIRSVPRMFVNYMVQLWPARGIGMSVCLFSF